jgi:hypothetical protein
VMGRAFGANRAGCRFEIGSGAKPPASGRRRSHNQPARARAGAPEGGRAPRDRRCRAIAWCALFARESGAKPRPNHDPVNKPGLQPCPISCGQTPGRCPGLGWVAPLALTGRGAVLKLAQGKPPASGRRRSHNQPARARAGAPEGGRAPRDRRCRAIACPIRPRVRGKAPASSQPWPTAKVTDRAQRPGLKARLIHDPARAAICSTSERPPKNSARA